MALVSVSGSLFVCLSFWCVSVSPLLRSLDVLLDVHSKVFSFCEPAPVLEHDCRVACICQTPGFAVLSTKLRSNAAKLLHTTRHMSAIASFVLCFLGWSCIRASLSANAVRRS